MGRMVRIYFIVHFYAMRRKATKPLGLLRLLPRLLCFFSQNLGGYLEHRHQRTCDTVSVSKHVLPMSAKLAAFHEACH
jgi:hypothetical protein